MLKSPPFPVLAFAVLSILARDSGAAPHLPLNSTLFDCPFNHLEDPYNFDGLLSAVKALVESKLEHNRRCQAPFNQLLSNITTASTYYSSLDPNEQQRVFKDVYSRYRSELELQLANLEVKGQANGAQGDLIRQTLSTVDGSLRDNQISLASTSKSFADSRENLFRSQLYGSLNQLLQTLQGSSSECIEAVGGWSSLMPSLLGIASLATGYGTFGNQAVVGSAVQLAANLTNLFKDRKAKKALGELSVVENEKVLACTYYAIRYSSCEYRRAFLLSRDTQEIKRIIERRFSPEKQGEFERLSYSFEKLPFFRGIFDAIAVMGAPLTLDTNLLKAYLDALRADPERIAIPPPAATDIEKKKWLIDVKSRGIIFAETDMFGVQKSVEEQYQSAIIDITNKKATIRSVEAIITEKRSFEDLRHKLDDDFSSAIVEVGTIRDFLGGLIEGDHPRVPVRTQGSVYVFNDLLLKLEAFLAVNRNITCDSTETPGPADIGCYTRKVNDAGRQLFQAMARGAIAQVNEQSVLTLGVKSTDRMLRALSVVENQFLLEDLLMNRKGEDSYSQYRRDRAVLFNLTENYRLYSGEGVTGVAEKAQGALVGFEVGFEKEILEMVSRSFDIKSEVIPELNGKTAAHYCSLFASSLNKSAKGKRLLEKCRRYASHLEQVELISNGPIPIDFGNLCFYPDYIRTIKMQKTLLDRYLHLERVE
jgi:hypothetical protein